MKEALNRVSPAEINKKTPTGKTALNFAIWSQDPERVRLLLKAGAATNVIGEITPITYAATISLEIERFIPPGAITKIF